MMVRYMHPDMTPEHYRGNERTHHEEIPKSLFGGEEKEADEDLDEPEPKVEKPKAETSSKDSKGRS